MVAWYCLVHMYGIVCRHGIHGVQYDNTYVCTMAQVWYGKRYIKYGTSIICDLPLYLVLRNKRTRPVGQSSRHSHKFPLACACATAFHVTTSWHCVCSSMSHITSIPTTTTTTIITSVLVHCITVNYISSSQFTL